MAKNILKILTKLNSEDPSARRSAAEELAEGDERAIYPLIRALSDKNAGVQDAAMRSLISIGGEVAGYMVLPLLRENSYLRNTALIILGQLGGVSVPLLYPLLKDKDDDVRKFAIDLLGEIKEGVEPLKIVPCLKDTNANVRAATAKAIGMLGYSKGVPDLIKALRDDEWVCFSALDALGELMAVDSIGDIASLFDNPSEAVRFAAIETLGKLASDRGVDPLRSYLPKASEDERNAIIKSLIQIGISPEMADLSGHLVTMLKNGDWEEKEIALKGIAALKCMEAVPVIVDSAGSLDPSLPESEERLLLLRNTIVAMDSEDELLKLLLSPDIKYRGKAFTIEILGEIRSNKAVPALISYLGDMSRDLRQASVEALGEIGGAEAVGYLLEVSQRDVDAHVRRAAIEALGNIRTKEAYRPLLEILAVEKYYDVVEKIVEALIKIDPDTFLAGISGYNNNVREVIAKTVLDVDVLLKLAEDTVKKVRLAAIYRLGLVGNEKAISRLIWCLGDGDPDIRKSAVVGLGEARYCSSELFNALKDDDPWVRFYAIKAISFSCDREKAVELIKSMLFDEFVPVVMSAIDAIVEIGGREAYEALSVHETHPSTAVREKVMEALSVL